MRYGQWSGNPNGAKEDPARCIESVTPARQWTSQQCAKKRGHGPDGKYCKQHATKLEKIARLNKEYGLT